MLAGLSLADYRRGSGIRSALLRHLGQRTLTRQCPACTPLLPCNQQGPLWERAFRIFNNTPPFDRLTRAQRIAVISIVSNEAPSDTAGRAKVTVRTIRNWHKLPVFQEALAEARRDFFAAGLIVAGIVLMKAA